MESNKKKLITHNGSFHADDIFATATLSLILEKKDESFEIIRTRDESIIEKGDYVYDVGGIYDENTNRFDHHQKDFKEKRANGITYSSFGLIWEKFGVELTGSERIVEIIDKKLVAPIDAGDNAIDLVENKYDVSPYFIQSFFYSMRPTWKETGVNVDEMFLKCVEMAKEILLREITQAGDFVLAEKNLEEDYQRAKDKRVIILEQDYYHENVLNKYKEPLFVIYPRTDGMTWGVKAVKEDPMTFKNRKDFPIEWGGLRDEELQKITGVMDAVFCHKGLFMAVAKTREGVVKLAELALK